MRLCNENVYHMKLPLPSAEQNAELLTHRRCAEYASPMERSGAGSIDGFGRQSPLLFALCDLAVFVGAVFVCGARLERGEDGGQGAMLLRHRATTHLPFARKPDGERKKKGGRSQQAEQVK